LRENVTKLLCGLALAAALSGPAMAEEQLVMPFACRVAGGKVLLAPSAPQAYQIYGRAAHKRLTTCSPYDRRNCQNWFIHRFDLDCGGVRTSWQSVVAALSPILAESVRSSGDAYDDRAYAPRGAARPPGRGPRISFPPGFAPNPMSVARFKQIDAATAQIPVPPKKPAATAPSQIAKTAPSPNPAAAPSPSAGKAQAPKKTAVAKKPTEAPAYQALQIEIDSGSGEVTGSLPKSGAASDTLWRDAGTVFALTLAALLAFSATLLYRRRRMETLPLPAAHWPAARPAPTRSANAVLERATAQQPAETPATRLRLWDEDWLPATTSEALDVLGVDPHASRDMIKSTVTRLRRALHPDYALDEEDRALRERRLKQINVAWEIVSGKRRSLWLSTRRSA